MISYVEKSFSCLGATKFNQAIAVWMELKCKQWKNNSKRSNTNYS
jgi:hypothetical protein